MMRELLVLLISSPEFLSEATDSRIIDDSNILKVNDKDVVAFEAVDQCHDFFLLSIQAVCNFELI